MLEEIVLSESLDMRIPWGLEHYQKAKQEVPLQCFGVFVTARRANPLPRWPVDIHGCIGYWNSEFREESREVLLEKACEVGYKAFWEDERRDMFSRSILQEPESVCEIDFMMLPLIPIDGATGRFTTNNKLYDNNQYGLLIQSPHGSRATFLPKVLPKTSWAHIKTSLLKKADAVVGHFYAYRIRQSKVSLGSFCESPQVGLCLQTNFKKMLFQQIRKSYPFFPMYFSGSFQYSKEEEVRNGGLLLDMVEALQNGVSFTKAQERYLREAVRTMAHMPVLDQTKAFLLPCLTALGYRTEYLCRELMEKLPTMEREFTFGEALVGIATGGCKYLLSPYRKLLLESYPLSDAEDIFQVNWDCQALILLSNKSLPKEVLDSVIDILQANKFNEDTFTNVLAVAWELIQTVYPFCNHYYKKQLDIYRLYVCWLLQQRSDPEHPTVYHMLQGDARLDITSHVLGGWKSKQKEK